MIELPTYLQDAPQPRDSHGRFKPFSRRRHRSQPGAAEQARRVAWGKTWGGYNSTAAEKLREDET